MPLLVAWAVALMCCATAWAAPTPVTYYVNGATGSDAATGRAPEHALATVQRACDLVGPGDTVIVSPGVYYGPVQLRAAGTADRPITFRAANAARGAVVITGADRAIREGKVPWQLEDAALGLFSVPFPHEPARALYSGTDLIPYPSLDALKRFTFREGEPGVRHGFAFDAAARRLYVRLHPSGRYGPSDPSRHTMSLGAPAGVGSAGHRLHAPHTYNFGVLAPGDAHVVIEGFTFETPGVAGVYVSGNHVTVRRCWFLGCRAGVSGKTDSVDATRTSNHVVVEFCDYSQYPAFDDMVEVIRGQPPVGENAKPSIFWWQRKSSGVGGPKTYETGIASLVGHDWIVRNNYIHDTFEGLSTWCVRWSRRLEVRDNVFARVVDNAVETEDHAAEMRIHGNLIVDTFEPLSWQPLGGEPWPGPVYFYRNVLYTSPECVDLWRRAGWLTGWFKAGAPGSNWEHPHMAQVPQDRVRVPDPGFLVYNNTILFPGGVFLTRTQPFGRAFENFHFYNNLCLADGFDKNPDFKGSRMVFAGNLVAPATAGVAGPGELFAGSGGKVFADSAALGMEDPLRLRITLKPGSPAIGAAVPLTFPGAHRDVGALPAGERWQPPVVGPEGRRYQLPAAR